MDMRVVSENEPWFTSGSCTSHFPKFRGKLSKIRKCSCVSEELFELLQKMGHCGAALVQQIIKYLVFSTAKTMTFKFLFDKNNLIPVMNLYV